MDASTTLHNHVRAGYQPRSVLQGVAGNPVQHNLHCHCSCGLSARCRRSVTVDTRELTQFLARTIVSINQDSDSAERRRKRMVGLGYIMRTISVLCHAITRGVCNLLYVLTCVNLSLLLYSRGPLRLR